MDATRLRALIGASLNAQSAFEASLAAVDAARLAVDDARARLRHEAGNLKALIGDSFVIFGDKVVRVSGGPDGIAVHSYPLASCPVVAPPPVPLPEADPPAPRKAVAETSASNVPTSGGVVPPLGKKK